MPVLQRRPAMLDQRQKASFRNSADSDETVREQVVIVEDDYDAPQKAMDFPSAKILSASRSKNILRINTYSKTELHDRYMSSEEEPSPSPDSDASHEEELRHKPSAKFQDPVDLASTTESEPKIAIAVPILSLGRPKLVDITNLAPMHKRKQRVPKSQLPTGASKVQPTRLAAIADENAPFPAREASEIVTSPPPTRAKTALKRKESRPSLTVPSTWLPEDNAAASEEEQHLPSLEIRRTPSYHDYDPYSLDPPRLASCPRGSVARARGQAPPANQHSGWKGITRSLSLVKRQSHQQLAKKPKKMLARGADEREYPLVIPPFPFEGAESPA